MDCTFCGMPHMEWRMDENVGKSRLWDNNMNFWHDCKESPEAKKKEADLMWKKKRAAVLKEERQKKIIKLKTPIYCVKCVKSFKPIEPCKHMIEDGFELGVDGGDFYADTFKAIERRRQLQEKKNQSKQQKNKASLDKFI